MDRELDELLAILRKGDEPATPPTPPPAEEARPASDEARSRVDEIMRDVESTPREPAPAKTPLPPPPVHDPVVVPPPVSHFTDEPSADTAVRMRDRLDETTLPKPDAERRPTQNFGMPQRGDVRKKRRRKRPAVQTLPPPETAPKKYIPHIEIPDELPAEDAAEKANEALIRDIVAHPVETPAPAPAPVTEPEPDPERQAVVRSKAELIREQLRRRMAEEAAREDVAEAAAAPVPETSAPAPVQETPVQAPSETEEDPASYMPAPEEVFPEDAEEASGYEYEDEEEKPAAAVTAASAAAGVLSFFRKAKDAVASKLAELRADDDEDDDLEDDEDDQISYDLEDVVDDVYDTPVEDEDLLDEEEDTSFEDDEWGIADIPDEPIDYDEEHAPSEEASYEEPAQEPYYEEPAQEPSYEGPAQEPYYEEPAQEPSYEEPAQDAYDEPAQEPYYEEPAQDAYDEPVQEPYYEEPAQEPYYDEPAQEPYYEEPAQDDTPAEEAPAEAPRLRHLAAVPAMEEKKPSLLDRLRGALSRPAAEPEDIEDDDIPEDPAADWSESYAPAPDDLLSHKEQSNYTDLSDPSVADEAYLAYAQPEDEELPAPPLPAPDDTPRDPATGEVRSADEADEADDAAANQAPSVAPVQVAVEDAPKGKRHFTGEYAAFNREGPAVQPAQPTSAPAAKPAPKQHTLRDAFDETAEELAEMRAEPETSDAAHAGHPFLKRNSYLIVGVLCALLAVVGLVSVVKAVFLHIKDFADGSSIRQEITDVLYPLAVTDMPAFEDTSDISDEYFLSAAIMDILMFDDLSAYPENFDVISVPLEDVLLRGRRMFGAEYSPAPVTIHTAGETFFYDEQSHCFNVPSAPVIFSYAPEIQKISRSGDTYTVTVLYRSDIAQWQARSKNFATQNEKTMQVVLDNKNGLWRIVRIANVQN